MFSKVLDVEYTVEWLLNFVETWRGLERVKRFGRKIELSLESKIKCCKFL